MCYFSCYPAFITDDLVIYDVLIFAMMVMKPLFLLT